MWRWYDRQPAGELFALLRAGWVARPDRTPILILADFLDEQHPPAPLARGKLPRGFVAFFGRERLQDVVAPRLFLWRHLPWWPPFRGRTIAAILPDLLHGGPWGASSV